MICLKENSHGAEILTDYCAGALELVRAAELEAHLHDCTSCRSEVEAQRQVWDALDIWPTIEVSPDFDARLYARIETENKRWWRPAAARRLLWNPLFPAAAAAAALAVALLAWIPEHRSSQPGPSATASIQNIDAQQLEQALDDMDLLTPVSQSPRVL